MQNVVVLLAVYKIIFYKAPDSKFAEYIDFVSATVLVQYENEEVN